MNFFNLIKLQIAKRLGYEKKYLSKLNLDDTFPCFAPRSGGDYYQRADLTIDSVNFTIPALNLLSKSFKNKELVVNNIKEVINDNVDYESGERLASLLNEYGSDKAGKHDYFWLYGKILKKSSEIKKILEIGIGTNNTDVISNMGEDGMPGASLRAFKSFCKNANIYGADIDKRVLFQEERIKTYFLDQTNLDSYKNLEKEIGDNFDLIIDDGLHEPRANVYSLNFGLKLLKEGGWMVIEDIYPAALPVWTNVSNILPENIFKTFIYKNKRNRLIFAVNKQKIEK